MAHLPRNRSYTVTVLEHATGKSWASVYYHPDSVANHGSMESFDLGRGEDLPDDFADFVVETLARVLGEVTGE